MLAIRIYGRIYTQFFNFLQINIMMTQNFQGSLLRLFRATRVVLMRTIKGSFALKYLHYVVNSIEKFEIKVFIEKTKPEFFISNIFEFNHTN